MDEARIFTKIYQEQMTTRRLEFENFLNDAFFKNKMFIVNQRCGKSYMLEMMLQYLRSQGNEPIVLKKTPQDLMERSPFIISGAELKLGEDL